LLLSKRDIAAYLVGAALVALMIWLDLKLDDSGVTFVLVSLFPMMLAIWRRERPWRWGILFSIPLIVASFLAAYPFHMVREKNPAYSIVALVPALMGAYLGALCRRAFEALWQEKE
jgi:NADH:ubiquinone oxidoreductase subunit 6 (subunit J)